MSNGDPNGGRYTVGGRTIERLDDVSERLSKIEGQLPHLASKSDLPSMESYATKEDVANAKLSMIHTLLMVGLAFVAAVINIAIVLFRAWGQ